MLHDPAAEQQLMLAELSVTLVLKTHSCQKQKEKKC